MKPRTLRAALRDELTQRVVPKILEAGFAGPSAISGNELLHEFRRIRGPKHEAVVLQLERSGLPRFILNLHSSVAAAAEVVEHGGLVLSARVKATPRNLDLQLVPSRSELRPTRLAQQQEQFACPCGR